MTRNLTILAAAACLAIGGWVLANRSAEPADPLGAAFAQDAADVDTSNIQEMTLGDPDAPVTMIEYASFTCPHCAAFHTGPFKKLKTDYIDTGKVHFVYREVYFDKFGFWAAIVARCGEGAENRFFGIVDMIYDKQREWANSENGQEQILEALRKIGKTGGLTDTQLDACFSDGEKANALYALYQQRAEEDGIDSTPSFIIDGRKHRNMPYEEMQEVLDTALAG